MVIFQGKEEELLDSNELKVYHQTRTSLCWTEGNKVVDDNTDHRGQGWYFSSWIQSIFWKDSECSWWSRHICREIPWRCNRSAMTSSQRNDEAKGYWNPGYDTNSESSLLFKAKWYDEENRRKLSSSSKIVLRKEGPDSTVKKLHDNDIADRARNDLKGY